MPIHYELTRSIDPEIASLRSGRLFVIRLLWLSRCAWLALGLFVGIARADGRWQDIGAQPVLLRRIILADARLARCARLHVARLIAIVALGGTRLIVRSAIVAVPARIAAALACTTMIVVIIIIVVRRLIVLTAVRVTIIIVVIVIIVVMIIGIIAAARIAVIGPVILLPVVLLPVVLLIAALLPVIVPAVIVVVVTIIIVIRVIVAVVITIVAVTRLLLVLPGLEIGLHAEIVIGELQIIFRVHPVIIHLRILRELLVFLQKLSGIAARAIVDPVLMIETTTTAAIVLLTVVVIVVATAATAVGLTIIHKGCLVLIP